METFIFNVLQDDLQILALATIGGFFLIAFAGLLRKSGGGVLPQLAVIAPNTLTSIGIFFTFLGILLALYEFELPDTDRGVLNEAVSNLVERLKLAFFSSVIGLLTSVIFRLFDASIQGITNRSTPTDIDISHLHQQLQLLNASTLFVKDALASESTTTCLADELKTINANTLSVREALVGEGDASLSTQFSKLRNDFRDYADNVRKDGTQELVKALQEVISDFNVKISEQFGDNFKQLNEAVSSLLAWQQEYKEQVSFLTNAFIEVQSGIQTIEKTSSKIPEYMQSIETVFKLTDQRIEELHSGIGSLAKLRESAENVVPEIQKSIDSVTEAVRTSIEGQIKVLRTQIEDVQSVQSANREAIEELTESFSKTIQTSLKQIETSAEQAVPEVKKSIDAISVSLQESITGQVTVLKTQIEDVQSVQSANREAIEGLTESFAQTIQTSLKQIETSAEQAVPEVKKSIEAISVSLQESITGQVTVLKTQIEDVQSVQSANREAIEGLTESFAQTIQTSLKQIETSAEQAVPEVKKSIDAISVSLTGSIAGQVDALKQQILDLNTVQSSSQDRIERFITTISDVFQDAQTQINTAYSQQFKTLEQATTHLTDGAKTISDSSETISKRLSQVIEEFYTEQEQLSRVIQKNIQESINENVSTMNENFKSFDEGMQKEIGRVLDKMANNLLAITGEFTKTYERYEECIQKIVELSKSIEPK